MVLQSTPIETCLPLSIIHYVEKTPEGLIETNVAREGRFTQDSYIKTQQPPRSPLPTPDSTPKCQRRKIA